MIEREPTFEDDNLRTWSFDARDREPSQFEGDPTLMYVDVDHEEIYESRTYRFQATPEVLDFLVDVAAARLAGTGARPTEIVPFARELLDDTTFKFLAKRSKEDGQITSMLVAVGGGTRSLILRQDQVQEDEYRQAVQAFETTYLPEGILDPPLVVTLEEWRRYAEGGPFAEERPGS